MCILEACWKANETVCALRAVGAAKVPECRRRRAAAPCSGARAPWQHALHCAVGTHVRRLANGAGRARPVPCGQGIAFTPRASAHAMPRALDVVITQRVARNPHETIRALQARCSAEERRALVAGLSTPCALCGARKALASTCSVARPIDARCGVACVHITSLAFKPTRAPLTLQPVEKS